MRMKYLLSICLWGLCYHLFSMDYTGNEMLSVLGKSVNSSDFKQYKDFWLLDNNYQNPYGGLKLAVNPTLEVVDTIVVAGYGYSANGSHYANCSSKLPYDIKLDDNMATIAQKMGVAGVYYDGRASYHAGDYDMVVKYADAGKIKWVKFFPNRSVFAKPSVPALNVAAVEPVLPKVENVNTESAHVAETATASSNGSISRMDAARMAFENASYSKPVHTETTKPKVNTPVTTTASAVTKPTAPAATPAAKPVAVASSSSTASFRQSIMGVFESWRNSGFYSIKGSPHTINNYWNYKYTYGTKLHIPGEKYNMLYSFPFDYSQLDFVSVLKESDYYDSSFDALYKDFEHKLMENFKQQDGWYASCLPNTDGSKLSDLEVRNDRYGSIILDYTKTPHGKHILYLRFLLYSN